MPGPITTPFPSPPAPACTPSSHRNGLCSVPSSEADPEPSNPPNSDKSTPSPGGTSDKISTPKRYLRGGLGILGGIAVWDIYYNVSKDRDLGDWFQKFSWDNFRNLGFDNNSLFINRVGHALGGTGYFLSCRLLGGLSELESAGCAVAGSLVFEVVAEEKSPSVNDQIFTPIAGTAIGATVDLFIKHVRGDNSNPKPGSVTEKVNDPAPRPFEASIGMENIHSRFEENSATRNVLSAEFRGELNRVPGHGREGMRQGMFKGKRADFSVLASADAEGVHDLKVSTQASLLGHQWEAFSRTPGALLHGKAIYLGAGSSFDYQKFTGRGATPEDHLGAAGLGAIVDAEWRLRAGLRVHAKGDLFGEFAMASSYAFDSVGRDYSPETIKPTLSRHGYYFGLGLRGRIRLTAIYRGYELGFKGERRHIDSIEGASRRQENITNDFPLNNTRSRHRLWLSRSFGFLKLSGEIEAMKNMDRAEDVQRGSTGLRAGFKVGLIF